MIKKFTIENDDAIDISIGHNHIIVTTLNIMMYSWGDGYKGKLGQGYSE